MAALDPAHYSSAWWGVGVAGGCGFRRRGRLLRFRWAACRCRV